MNIFWLHKNGRVMALLHCDKHVVKMILEIAQMASNVYYHYSGETGMKLYKRTHAKHPMSIFMCQCLANFELACTRGLFLCREYTRRYNKEHKCEEMLRGFIQCPPDFSLGSPPDYSESTVFGRIGDFSVPLCITDSSLHHPNAVVAYLQYYLQKLDTVPGLRKWNKKPTLALPLVVRLLISKSIAAM